MSWGTQTETAIVKPLLEEFEKQNPDIRIEFMHVPQNYFQKLHLLYAARLEPDVVFINNIYMPVYQAADLLTDLTPYFKKELDEKVFFDKAVANFSIDGKLYAIPRDISNLVVYYNKDLFDKYYVSYPTKDWTLDDMLQKAKKLTDTSSVEEANLAPRKDLPLLTSDSPTAAQLRKNKFSRVVQRSGHWGISRSEKPVLWMPYLLSNGGGVLNEKNEIILDKKESMKSLQFYADLANVYKVAPTTVQCAGKQLSQMFMDGEIAMHVSGRWAVPSYRKNIKFKWDIINFPNGSAGSIVGADSSGWAISKNSVHKDEALKLIKYLSSKSASEKFTSGGLIIPARVEVASSNIFLDPKLPPQNSKVFIDIIKDAKPTPANKNYREIEDILNTELEPLFRGTKSVEEIMNEGLVKKLGMRNEE